MTAPTAAPSAERLDAAVRVVVERLRPDQIILFGSGARGQMTPASDLDLLVITGDDGRGDRTHHECWQCAEAGGQIDVIVTNRATAERNRLSAARVHGIALEEGRTVYLRDGTTPTPTGPTYTREGNRMVRTTKYEPDHAAKLLRRAETKWEDANTTREADSKCEYLQRSLEYAFKALVVADGRRVEHVHDLDNLWGQAEATGERIDATRDPKQLETLSRYAGPWRYDEIPPDENSVETWENNRTTGEDVLKHARRRVPHLVEQTRQALASRGATTAIGGETPSGGPGDAPDPAQGTAAQQQQNRTDDRDRTP